MFQKLSLSILLWFLKPNNGKSVLTMKRLGVIILLLGFTALFLPALSSPKILPAQEVQTRVPPKPGNIIKLDSVVLGTNYDLFSIAPNDLVNLTTHTTLKYQWLVPNNAYATGNDPKSIFVTAPTTVFLVGINTDGNLLTSIITITNAPTPQPNPQPNPQPTPDPKVDPVVPPAPTPDPPNPTPQPTSVAAKVKSFIATHPAPTVQSKVAKDAFLKSSTSNLTKSTELIRENSNHLLTTLGPDDTLLWIVWRNSLFESFPSSTSVKEIFTALATSL